MEGIGERHLGGGGAKRTLEGGGEERELGRWRGRGIGERTRPQPWPWARPTLEGLEKRKRGAEEEAESVVHGEEIYSGRRNGARFHRSTCRARDKYEVRRGLDLGRSRKWFGLLVPVSVWLNFSKQLRK